MEYLEVIGPTLLRSYKEVLGLSVQVMPYLGVIGQTFFPMYQKGLGLSLQVREYLEVIGLILAQVMQYLGAIGLLVRYGLMMVRLRLQVVEYLEVIGYVVILEQVVYGKVARVFRRASPEARSRVASQSAGDLLQGLSDGDMYGVRPMEEAYRVKSMEIDGTFGDYNGGFPPGLGGTSQGVGRPEDVQEAPTQSAGLNPSAEPDGPQPSSQTPSPLDVLITGMSQLQQVLLKQKGGDTMDLEPKAVVELSKLPEYTPESGATDFQDYLYLTEQQVGSLASGATDWWQRTLQVAQRAYGEYQSLSPMKRLSVKAVLPEDLKEEKYKKLKRKVASLLLNSLPKGVRDELVAHRVQGVHQILFRLMVVFQPGGAQDRAQLLRQLDVSDSSPGPAEAVLAIRKWYRLLQRAADLNIALPDESLQVRSLSNIVRRTAEAHGDFKFRVALAKTELQIDSRPSQQNVMKFLHHLLAELEQLGAGTKKSSAPTASPSGTSATTAATTTTTPPSLKGVQPTSDGGAGGKGKQKGAVPAAKRPCQWFSSDQGNFVTGETDASASTQEFGNYIYSIGYGFAHCTATGSGGNGNKIDTAKMTEVLSETNKMLKALASQSGGTATATVDPLVLIQQQLDEVRRLKTLRVQEPGQGMCSFNSAVTWYEARLNATSLSSDSAAPPEEEAEALLDSGASHPFRPPRSQEELDRARRVNVSLATGDGALLPQTAEGTLLAAGGDDTPIIPMGQLVQMLGCQIKWTKSRLTVHHPVHGRLQVRLRGNCPVLPVSQALTLIAELEQARVTEFQRTVDGLQAQVRVLREQGREEWTWQHHLRAFCEEGKRTSMAGFLHRCPTFASVPAEVLLGIPEDVPCDLQDGWKLLKGMPWSRAKRKAMFSSTSWTVHLFSGNERAMAAKCTSTMRSSFWSVALEGDEVMVNVDITDSRALDLTRRDAVFKVLCWAALSGRLKAIVGGPPRQSYPAPVHPDQGHPQYQKETQLITRMMMLWYIAEEGRCKSWRQGMLRRSVVKPHVGFLLEHPEGGHRDDRRSLFSSPLWRAFSFDALMGEVACVMNGTQTVLGGNLDLWHLQGAELGAVLPGDPIGSMWPLELVANVTFLGRHRMNVEVEIPGYAGLMWMSGVFIYNEIICHIERFPRLPGTKIDDEKTEKVDDGHPVAGPAPGEDWLFEDGDPLGEVPHPEVKEPNVPVVPECDQVSKDKEDAEIEALKELAEPLEFSSVYIVRPMKARKNADTLKAVQEAYIQLRSCGLPVHKLHADRDDPSQNGTAERAVRFLKMRMRILLQQAKELSGLSTEVVASLWPYAAETASAQQQAEVWGQPAPSVARFGSKVFTRRKGYGQGGRTDLLPKWVEGVYLGPVRSVPGGHLVLTDEGNLWYTTNVRQFKDHPTGEGGSDADGEHPPPPPLRRVRRKSSIVDLAGGVGLIPGFDKDIVAERDEKDGLRALAKIAKADVELSSDDVVSGGMSVGHEEGLESSVSRGSNRQGEGPLAELYLCEGRFSMSDCLAVLESERFRKTKKQRTAAWQANDPPSVHTTLGAYQRGPWTGVTTATARHGGLASYLAAMLKHHGGDNMEFSSLTVAKDLNTDAHKDRFNMRGSRNYVLTLGNFKEGGIWQEGTSEGYPTVHMELGSGEHRAGYVEPVRNKVVQVDPKKLHKTMPWSGGPKWTIIAHTIGQCKKLDDEARRSLEHLGFVLPPQPHLCELRAVRCDDDSGPAVVENGPCWFPPQEDVEGEMWTRMWSRRVLDEEELLASVLPRSLADEFEGVADAVNAAARSLEVRESVSLPDRLGVEQWMSLCRMTEGTDEVHGVESLLESLSGPLKVVYTVALDEVKQFISRWTASIVKEADALIKAKALVPLTTEEQRILERSGKLIILPAKGVFTVKPPDGEAPATEGGMHPPPGDPSFYKRKARLVICGNFQGKQSMEDSYAGGCQTDSLRVMLVHCAALGWCLASTDIRNAFILAPIQEEDDEEEAVYALYPPKVFQLAKVQYALRLWRVDRALYGFRRSPRLWGRFRDKRLRNAKIPYGDGYIYLKQHKADENIWSVCVVSADGSINVRAYVNVYVIYCMWEKRTLFVKFSHGCIMVFLKYEAQAITGELLWLSGKSRPDLMHTISTMSSWCLKNPILVERIGIRALGYLKATIGLCLEYHPVRKDHYVEAFSDASFAPHGSRSVGCSLVRYLQQPVAWRSGRQALVALSVAEAELIETVNATQMAYGISAITEELHQVQAEITVKVDNAAAVGLSNEAGGSWKTRHLKVRAFHLREAVRLRELRIEHIPGKMQLGDLGTKAFSRPRLVELLHLRGLKTEGGGAENEEVGQSDHPAKINGTLAVLAKLVLIMGWMVQGSRASTTQDREERGIEVSMPWELYGLLLLGLIASIGVWEAIKWFFEWVSLKRSGSVEESRGARRLRRLQQAVQEEVARYGLDDPVQDRAQPSTPRPPSTRSTPQVSPFQARSSSTRRTASIAVQTDVQPDGYVPTVIEFTMMQHVTAFGMPRQGGD
ncbi:GIP, partial [Symbiodinium sp. CCMP2592]